MARYSDLIMTELKTENEQPITEGDIGGKTSPMHTLVGSEVDETFWENYNILKPESPDSLNSTAASDSISKAVSDALISASTNSTSENLANPPADHANSPANMLSAGNADLKKRKGKSNKQKYPEPAEWIYKGRYASRNVDTTSNLL